MDLIMDLASEMTDILMSKGSEIVIDKSFKGINGRIKKAKVSELVSNTLENQMAVHNISNEAANVLYYQDNVKFVCLSCLNFNLPMNNPAKNLSSPDGYMTEDVKKELSGLMTDVYEALWGTKEFLSKIDLRSKNFQLQVADELRIMSSYAEERMTGTMASIDLAALELDMSGWELVHRCSDPVDTFVGRDAELDELAGLLEDEDLIFINGFGGMGKSELCRAYVSTLGEAAPVVWLDYLGTMTDTIAQEIKIRGFEGSGNYNAEELSAIKLKFLSRQKGCLIIVDGYEYPKGDIGILDATGCKVIATTRQRDIPHGIPHIELKPLSEDQAFDLLASTVEDYYLPWIEKNRHRLRNLMESVEWNTYVIALIGSVMNATAPSDLDLEGGIFDISEASAYSGKDEEESYRRISDHICRLLEFTGLDEVSLGVLKAMTFIPPFGINLDIASWALVIRPDLEGDRLYAEKDSYEEFLNEMERTRILNLAASNILRVSMDRRLGYQVVTIHPLMRDAAIRMLSPSPDEPYEGLLITNSIAACFIFLKKDDIGMLTRHADCVIYMFDYVFDHYGDSRFVQGYLDKAGTKNLPIAEILMVCHRYGEAIERMETELPWLETSKGRKYRAAYYANLSLACINIGEAEKGRMYADKGMERGSVIDRISKEKTGISLEGNDVSIEAALLRNKGIALYHEGKLSEAMEIQKKALALSEKAGDHIGQSQSYTNMANIYSKMGRHEDAEMMHRLSSDHLNETEHSQLRTISAMKAEAKSAFTKGDVLRALEMMNDCADMLESCFPAGSDYLLDHYKTMFNYVSQLDESEYGNESVIGFLERVVKNFNPYMEHDSTYPDILVRESYVAAHARKRDLAIELGTKALEICDRTLGERSDESNECLFCIGLAYYLTGDKETAGRYTRMRRERGHDDRWRMRQPCVRVRIVIHV